jgi:hypothetical protein
MSTPTCHICDSHITDKKVDYYFTKFINDYGLPVSYCQKCIPHLLEQDPLARILIEKDHSCNLL